MSTRSLSALILLLAVPALVTALQKGPAAKKASDTFLNGPPFTFEQILRVIREKAIPPRRQKEAIQNRGVDFSVSTANLVQLEAAGAAPDLLELIVRLVNSITPPPAANLPTDRRVPAKHTGTLFPATAPGEPQRQTNIPLRAQELFG